jgi:hypothetical protein
MKTLIKKSKSKISKLFFSMMVAMLPIMNAFVTASAAGAGGLPQGRGHRLCAEEMPQHPRKTPTKLFLT